jgi:hypothetical protein
VSLVKRIHYLQYLLIGLLLITSACSTPTIPAVTPETPVASQQTLEPAVTETAMPTPTAQPKAALVGFGDDADPSSGMVQELVQELASQSGLQVEEYPDLVNLSATTGFQILIVSSSVTGIDSFAASNPSIPALVLGETDLQPGNNLNVIDLQGERADERGFIAGYLASVITQDWRVGVITQSNSVAGEAVRIGFNQGVVYYCGLCRPVYPPYYTYPVVGELAVDSSPESQQAVADLLIASAVKTVYVDGAVATESLLDYLAQAGIQIIGDQAPGAAIQAQWVATIQADLAQAFRQAWERIMAGESGFAISAPLTIQYANEQLFSAGRLRLVEYTLEELNHGFIGTGYEPEAGDS